MVPLKRQRQLAQSVLEAAIALPLAVIMFLTCLQMARLAMGHVTVLYAVYQAGRLVRASGDFQQSRALASRICGLISTGPTEFEHLQNRCRVTHTLASFLPGLPDFRIQYECPDSLFATSAE